MPLPRSWTAEAFNPVPESENRIHSDEIARAYGFRGALVPGVVVSAYLIHPAAEVWGRAWLEVGRASVVVHSPVYDGENFQLEIETASENAYEAVLVDERGVRCATAQVSLPDEISDPPSRRGDALLARDAERRWSEGAEITSYLRRSSEMAPVFRDEGLANPGFILGLTNWVLGRNVRMSPWLHLQTDSQHHRPVAPDTELVVEAAISDLFEKKGHEFVDVEVGVYQRSDDVAVASVRLRAIYLLRQP
ncbi:MAG: hypothetical protein JRG94_08110 [Deltaproteobacteria bacterium]|nr:hypothetical protein [Deltaproteobacteria bacterium]